MDKKDIYTSIYLSIYRYVMEYHSTIKKNVATWMDLEIIILSEVRERQNIIWYHLYVESKKKKWYK